MTTDGIPNDKAGRRSWLAAFRKERTCASARAVVDVIASACNDLDTAGTIDERAKVMKLIGELMSRAIAADKHQETLETAALRAAAEKHGRARSRLEGLH